MKYLGIQASELITQGGIHTAREICQQPELWKQIWNDFNDQQADIRQFMDEAIRNTKRIVLTGAGTSAFIGLSVQGAFQRKTGMLTEAIASTDIVSHPGNYFQATLPTLMISFARSGNSPESVAAVALLDEISDNCYHFIITCNADGKLAGYKSNSRKFIFTLPEEANDQSLAMTSSYSGMLLAGLLLANINDFKSTLNHVLGIAGYADKIITEFAPTLEMLAVKNFKRAVFLGAGPFYGTAVESHLKLQELSDGKVICKNDSFLGFRHGPKAVVDDSTLVVYFFSANKYAYQYEKDLVDDMKKGTKPMLELGIAEEFRDIGLGHFLTLSEEKSDLEEDFLSVCYVLPAQILGFYKSLELGLMPDLPSASGAITRVVQGVEIYSMS